MSVSPEVLPVHGFVLAGGKSSRMGQDKATLPFRGRPMVVLAVEKLRSFCANVAIAGNRDDLAHFAPVVLEQRVEIGPVAGLEAGLQAAAQPWCLFVPVDVPLVPQRLLRTWAQAVLGRQNSGVRASCLRVGGERQPAFCMLHSSCAPALSTAIQAGERRVGRVLEQTAGAAGRSSFWSADAETWLPESESETDRVALFGNCNTPDEFTQLERWAQQHERRD